MVAHSTAERAGVVYLGVAAFALNVAGCAGVTVKGLLVREGAFLITADGVGEITDPKVAAAVESRASTECRALGYKGFRWDAPLRWEGRGLFERNVVQGNATCLPVLDPLPPPLDQVSKECTETSEHDDSSTAIPLHQRVTCPWHPGNRAYSATQMFGVAVERAARTAVLVEHEGMLVWPADHEPGKFAVSVTFLRDALVAPSEPDGLASKSVYLRASTILSKEVLASLHEAVEIGKEDRTYGVCKHLLLDVDAAADNPSRAQACATTMLVIDRTREFRDRARRRIEEDLAARRQAERDEVRTNAALRAAAAQEQQAAAATSAADAAQRSAAAASSTADAAQRSAAAASSTAEAAQRSARAQEQRALNDR